MSFILRNRSFKSIITSRRFLSISHSRLAEQKVSKQELLPDERLQELVAALERPSERQLSDSRDVIRSIGSLKPQSTLISSSEMDKLYNRLNNGFTVRQLADFLRANKIPQRYKDKKKNMLANIIQRHWGIKTYEQVQLEEKEKLKDRVRKSFAVTRQELFFIFADEGEGIRRIEQDHQVNVTIDVENFVYIIEGPSKAIEVAKHAIDTQLTIVEGQMDLPPQMINNEQLQSEINDALGDASKIAGSYISLDDNKFSLFSLSEEKLSNTKQLLKLLLKDLVVTDEDKQKALESTIVQNQSDFTVLPIQDSSAMSIFDRHLNWVRTKQENIDNENEFKLLVDGQKIGRFENIKDILLKPFKEHTTLNDISLEARFGYLLFQNDGNMNSNSILDLYKNRTLFLNTIPPRQLTAPFIPFTLNEGFHQRSIQVAYSNNNNKIQLEFVIDENGNINVKRTIGEKKRSMVDVLGVHGNIDIRLIAKQYEEYNPNDKPELANLINQCELLSYNEFTAPKEYENMMLSDITFLNKKRYIFNDNLICLNHIEQQDKLAKRTELTVTSVDPQTLDLANAVEKWPSFSQLLNSIASQWVYSGF